MPKYEESNVDGEQFRVGTDKHWCSVTRERGYWDVHYMWGGHIAFAFTRWGARRKARLHLRSIAKQGVKSCTTKETP